MGMMLPTQFDFPVLATGTTFDLPINERGKFNYVLLKTPAFTNTVTTKLSIIDKDGDVVWDMTEDLSRGQAVTAQAKSTTTRYQFEFDIPVYRGWTLRATLSGVAGGTGGKVKAVVMIEANK